ncbi:MAG: non-hydrolyzing UDP-N-acetylglucosamine 2-epimerase [Angustibacter sp.]
MRRVAIVVGTRPEAIKVAPVIRRMHQSAHLEPYVVSTAQHGPVLHDALTAFGITPDVDLAVHRDGQTPGSVTATVLERLGELLRDVAVVAVLVQGDTASAFAGALAAFYAGVPLVHLEAGLRSGNRREPFPEEMHRRLITGLTDLHLAPTEHARDRLLAEGIRADAIQVTGNTVLDAVAISAGTAEAPGAAAADVGDPRVQAALDGPDRVVLATVHRRESWGPALDRIASALGEVADHPGVVVVLPMHPNPAVRAVLTARLGDHPSVVLADWQPHDRFLVLVRHAYLVLTDSGGVQEEAPSFGVPVLVMRDVTDRPEAVAAGSARLVGTHAPAIVAAAVRLLSEEQEHARMAAVRNPFGDGDAAQRCVVAVERMLATPSPLLAQPTAAGAVPAVALTSVTSDAVTLPTSDALTVEVPSAALPLPHQSTNRGASTW